MLVLVLLSMFLIVVVLLLLLLVAAVASRDCGPGGRCCALPHAPSPMRPLKSGTNVLSQAGLASASFSLCNCYLTARSNTKRHHRGSAK